MVSHGECRECRVSERDRCMHAGLCQLHIGSRVWRKQHPLAPGKGLERGSPFSNARALRNLKTCFELVYASRQWIHGP